MDNRYHHKGMITHALRVSSRGTKTTLALTILTTTKRGIALALLTETFIHSSKCSKCSTPKIIRTKISRETQTGTPCRAIRLGKTRIKWILMSNWLQGETERHQRSTLAGSERQGTTTNSKGSRGKQSDRLNSNSRENRERLTEITLRHKVFREEAKALDLAQTMSKTEIRSSTRAKEESHLNLVARFRFSSHSSGQMKDFKLSPKGQSLHHRAALSREGEDKAFRAKSSLVWLETKVCSRHQSLEASSQY